MLIPSLPSELEDRLQSPVPQPAFTWIPERWEKALGGLPGVMEGLRAFRQESWNEFGAFRVDRELVRNFVQQQLETGHVVPAFVAVMTWGYGTTGYGPTRTRWVLTGERSTPSTDSLAVGLEDRLLDGARRVQEYGPLEAFRLMNNSGRVKFLGGPFFTKWLYFASARNGVNDPEAAPIFDGLVRRWLSSRGVALSPYRTAGYEAYIETLDAWGRPYGRSRVVVEQQIFELSRAERRR